MKSTMAPQLYTINDFRGGLNKKTSEYSIKRNEAVGLINTTFDEYGSLVVRKGYQKLTDKPVSSGNNVVNSMFKYYKKSGVGYLIATAGTGVYYDNNSVWTSIGSDVTFTANQRFKFTVFDDLLYMTNGANKPCVWSGAGNIRQVGIVAPSSGTTTLASSGLCTDGVHQVKITYYNSTDDVESAAYGLTERTCGGGNNKITLGSLAASTDPQVDKVRIYMTVAGGTDFYLVTEQVDTTTTYDISLSDATLQGNASFPNTSNYPPPTDCRYIATSKRRLFLAHNSTYKSRLYYSESGAPEYFPLTNYLDISKDDGDVITGIMPFNDYLYVFKGNSTYAVVDPADPSTSTIQEISRHLGCFAPHTLCLGQFQRKTDLGEFTLIPGIVSYTRYGIMGFDGSRYHPLSEKVEPIFRSVYQPNVDEFVGFFNNGKYYLSYTPDKGNSVDGGNVTYAQPNSDSGAEYMTAAYSTNYDANVFDSTYDAKINLSKLSKDNGTITIRVRMNWNPYDDAKTYYSNTCHGYTVFFSYDNGVTWSIKGSYNQVPNVGNVDDANIKVELTNFYFDHAYVDSAVTNVRLDYMYKGSRNGQFNTWDTDAIGSITVDLLNVSYEYEYTSTVLGYNVVNNRMLYYDSLCNAWAEWRGIKANCFCAAIGAGDQGEEYFGGSDTGYVYQMNIGSQDDGNGIFWLYDSKNHALTDDIHGKRITAIMFNARAQESDVSLQLFTDRVERFQRTVSLRPTSGYQTTYGTDYFGSVVADNALDLNKKLIPVQNAYGRYVQLKLWGVTKSPTTIENYSIRFVEREGYNG
jgi:hypothetical protein